MRTNPTRIVLWLAGVSALWLAAVSALSVAAVSAALAQTPVKGVNFFSIEKEIELGKQLAAETQTSLQAQPDAHLQAIGDALAAKTGGVYQYRFFVYSSVNPESEPTELPGGPVFVAQSMVQADDSVTAAILAHAMAHIALRHYTREMTRTDLMEIGRKGLPPDPRTTSSSPAIEMGMAQFKRKFELDADRLAVKLMMDAGYNPEALVRWLQAMPPQKPGLFDDFPAPTRRVEAVQLVIQGQ
jgi:beta-barrel assembly-enhancing protease